MKRDWIKLQVDILNDPTIGRLPDDLFRRLLELSMLAGENDKEGMLPGVEDIAWRLRVDLEELMYALYDLQERGLVHESTQGWVVTGFKESQAAPNSTERSRTSRRRRFFATEPGETGEEEPYQSTARCGTEAAVEMQLLRPYPVAGPVPVSNPDPGQPKRSGKSRHRHKVRPIPVENPVDNFVEKGRKNSDIAPSTTSSLTSSSINNLKTSLNLKLPLLELLGSESENFRLSQGKTLKNKRGMAGNAQFASVAKIPPNRIDQGAEQTWSTPEGIPEPVDKTVDNFVEKSRKNSDPDKNPP